MRKTGYLLMLLSIVASISCHHQSKQAQVFYDGGNAQVKMGNMVNSIVYFNKAISLDSTRADYYMARANSKLSIVDYKGAVADYTKVTMLDPKRAEAFLSRGIVKVYMKQFTNDAVSDFTTSLQLDPSLVNAWYNIGVIKFVQKDIDAACIDWHKAADMGSTQALANISKFCK